jgi:hypothetical protein
MANGEDHAGRSGAKECWKKFWRGIGKGFTGEWMFFRGRANGGAVIFLRSVQITVIMCAFALALHSGTYAEWTWRVWTWRIDSGQLQHEVADNVTWLGAVFAGVYAALYARFASQWSYLGGEYNQMRQTLVTASKDPGTDHDHLRLWKAGFVEDALDLHLATKTMFAPFILRVLKDHHVAKAFDAYTVHGQKGRNRLQKQLKKKYPNLDAAEDARLERLKRDAPTSATPSGGAEA